MRGLVVGLALVSAGFLASCATLSDEECLTADWYGIGYADGVKGRLPDYVLNHAEACSEVGISPDIAAWRAGRDAGLGEYCTPQNAYRIGRRGRSLALVCPARGLALLEDANRTGLAWYRIEQDIGALQRDIRAVENDIRAIGNPQDDAQGRELRRLRRELRRLERQEDALRREQRAYSSY